jgi:aminomethyltransferase
VAKRTPLYARHVQAGARMVEFGGWDMSLHYGSQVEEHHAVRRAAGMFDVSHMTLLDVAGPQAHAFLQYLLANDVAKLQTAGKALYSCMLNARGGVIDDLIVYRGVGELFRVIVNAATCDKDLAWMREVARAFEVRITHRTDLAMLAVQGPQARGLAAQAMPAALQEAVPALAVFDSCWFGDMWVGRTGYTGEDGVEWMLPAAQAEMAWDALAVAGVSPCGLGARDTLRLEAGLPLYGLDMNDDVSPWEAGLGWTVALRDARSFIGREALERQRESGVAFKQVGLLLTDRSGVLRAHQRVVVEGQPDGEVTSGTFSPTLNVSVALARVPVATGAHCHVEIRGKRVSVQVVKPPFVRHGKAVWQATF